MALLFDLLAFLFGAAVIIGLVPISFRLLGRLIGNSIRSKTSQRRELLFNRAASDDRVQAVKDGGTLCSSDIFCRFAGCSEDMKRVG